MNHKPGLDSIDHSVKLSFTITLINFFLQIQNKIMLEAYTHGGEEELKTYIYSKMWYPNYRPLVYLPPGKGE